VVYNCNPAPERLRQSDGELEANLGYVVRPCLKNKISKPNKAVLD
jgi:hypothetical protein